MNIFRRLFQQTESQPVPERTVATSGLNALPGNFCLFEAFLELQLNGTVVLGLPKYAIPDQSTGVVRWSSKLEWAWPDPTKPRMTWVYDPATGNIKRPVRKPDHLIGVKGRVGATPFVIERVLEVGTNQVVFSFYSESDNVRMAYGFTLGAF